MPTSNDLIQAQILVLNSTAIKVLTVICFKVNLMNDLSLPIILNFSQFKWDFKSNSILQLTSWKILLKDEHDSSISEHNLTKDTTEYEFTNLGNYLLLKIEKEMLVYIYFYIIIFSEPNATYVIELCALNYAEIVNCIRKRADLKKITSELRDKKFITEHK